MRAALISGSQIKNHSIPAMKLTKPAIKSLHGKRGARGPKGATGATGSQGPQGIQGAKGTVGTPATKLFAAVDSNATFAAAQSSGVTTVTSGGTGLYTVVFDQNVRDCTYVVEGGAPGNGASGSAGFYNATGGAMNVDSVFVLTRDTSDTPVDNSFYLAVFC